MVQRGRSHLHSHCKHIELVGIVRVQISNRECSTGLGLISEVGSSIDLKSSDDVVPDDSILQCVLWGTPCQSQRGGCDIR